MKIFVVFIFVFLNFFIHGSSESFEYPFRYCSNATFSPNSTYLSNLKILSSSLSSNASHKLYHNSSVIGRPPNATTYGDFQCRGDLDVAACRECVDTAAADSLQEYCPLSIWAVIWFDECVLRYSNQSFFSISSELLSFVMYNLADVDADVDAFDKVVIATLNATAEKASSARGMLKFATKEVNFENVTVYTLAQCSGDLSNFNCEKCLRLGLGTLPNYCSGKKGARFLSPSCMLRYELYHFYRGISSSADSPPDLNPSPVQTPSPPAAPPSLPSSPSAPALSTAAPPLLPGKWRATVALVIGIVIASYFL